jgi:hypothetical protein
VETLYSVKGIAISSYSSCSVPQGSLLRLLLYDFCPPFLTWALFMPMGVLLMNCAKPNLDTSPFQ